MSNMSYCRFENTVSDLVDCEEHIHDRLRESSHWRGGEKTARIRLIESCKRILEEVGYEVTGELDPTMLESGEDEDHGSYADDDRLP